MVPILFTYGGWQSANYVGEEIANPKQQPAARAGRRHDRGRRHLPHASTSSICARSASTGLAATHAPAADAARRMFGASGDVFVSGAIAISTFGFLDLSILAPTRVYYAMAADRLFVPALATLHPRYATPSLAIIVQSTWSCVLALTGIVRSARQLRRLRRLDLLRPDGADRAHVPAHAARSASAPADAFRAPGYPVVQIAVRPRRRRRRRQRRLARRRRRASEPLTGARVLLSRWRNSKSLRS